MKFVATPIGSEYVPTTFSIILSAASSLNSPFADHASTCSSLRLAISANFILLSATDSL